MQQANETALKELEEKIADADENLGDIEVRDAHLAKSEYLCKIGEIRFAMLSCVLQVALHRLPSIVVPPVNGSNIAAKAAA